MNLNWSVGIRAGIGGALIVNGTIALFHGYGLVSMLSYIAAVGFLMWAGRDAEPGAWDDDE